MVWVWFFFAFTVTAGGENGGEDTPPGDDDSGFWNSVISGISEVVQGVKGITSGILNGLKEILISLFVPEEDYFSSKFEQIKTKFMDRVGIDTSGFDELENVSAEDINFEATVLGINVKFIDLSFLEGILSKFHDLVRGFLYPLLIFYNMDQIYFMIRGSHLYKRGGGGDDE